MTQDQPSQGQPNSDGQAPQRSSGFLEDQQSRRLFLRAAVISGAAVAAVGAAGVAAANASPQILRQLRGQPATMSGQLPANMCFENSGYTPISQFDVKGDGTGQGTYFVWFSVQDLPAGTYTFTLTPDPGAPPPFEYNDPGNNVFTFEADKNITAPVCPDLAWWNAHTPTKSTHAISGVGGAFPYQLNSESAFLVKVHIDYKGPVPPAGGTPYTFVGTLTNTSTLVTYTGQVPVTAFPK